MVSWRISIAVPTGQIEVGREEYRLCRSVDGKVLDGTQTVHPYYFWGYLGVQGTQTHAWPETCSILCDVDI